MSLISDLLAKVKRQGEKGDIPPTLRDDVLRSYRQKQSRKRWMVLSLLVLIGIGAGAGMLSLLGPLQQPIPRPAPRTVEVVGQAANDRQIAGPKQLSPSPPPTASPEEQPAAPLVEPPGVSSAPEAIHQSPGAERERPPDQAASVPETPPGRLPEKQRAALATLQGSEPETRGSGNVGRRGRGPAGVGFGAGAVENAPDGEASSAENPGPVQKNVSSPSTSTLKSAEAGKSTRQARPQTVGGPARGVHRDKDLYLYKASTYDAEHNWQQALANYQKVLSLDPKNYAVLTNVAGVFLRMGSYEEAIRYAEKALAIKPGHVPALINLSIAYLRTGQESLGECCLRKALAIQASNPSVLLNLAILYEQQNNLDSAREYYGKLAAQGNPQGCLGVARIAEQQGRTVDAVNAYKALLALDNAGARERSLANERIVLLTR
jgi:Tfp pilus assembly protein PilF